jgi:molybdopterin converting factor subunit 1
MRVRVRLFASLRDLAGCDEIEMQLADGATADEAWKTLVGQLPMLASERMHLAVAVNRRYATFATALEDGDEVVFIPPIAGG